MSIHSQFSEDARRYHATTIIRFGQRFFMSEMNAHALAQGQGQCFGFAVGWMAATATGSDDFVETATWAAGVHDYAYQNSIDTAHQGLHSLQHAPVLLAQFFQGCNLNQVATSPFHQAIGRYRAVAGFCVAPGFCRIDTPNHAMATCSRPNDFRFFDPNFGEVRFTSANHLRSFMVRFFRHRAVTRAYRGVGRTGRIRFTVTRYT